MKKRIISLSISVVMAVSLLAGCGSSGQTGESSTDAAAEVTTAAKEASASGNGLGDLTAFGLPSGDIGSLPELKPVEEFSEEDIERIDRAIRAYQPAFDQAVLVNEAEHFFYYEQLDTLGKVFYDAMLMVTEDPVTEDYYVSVNMPSSEEPDVIMEAYKNAYFAMTYDHPELFWLYNTSENYIDIGTDASGANIYFFMDKPYANFETEVTAFNRGAQEILSSVDLNGSDYDIAKNLHDKLCETASYDHELLTMAQQGITDLGHTAYGVFVENSRGNAHTAVCDGYALAYEYLLQQVGIDVAFIAGVAGPTESEMGGHAWNVINLDNEWYEVDSTWDDNVMDMRYDIPSDIDGYEYYMEAYDDPDYYEKVGHFLFCLTTPEISHFVPGDEYNYTSKDGMYTYSLVSESFRVRAADAAGMEGESSLSRLTPDATGTKY